MISQIIVVKRVAVDIILGSLTASRICAPNYRRFETASTKISYVIWSRDYIQNMALNNQTCLVFLQPPAKSCSPDNVTDCRLGHSVTK